MWDNLRKPKHLGRLRFRKFRDANAGLVLKLGWFLLVTLDRLGCPFRRINIVTELDGSMEFCSLIGHPCGKALSSVLMFYVIWCVSEVLNETGLVFVVILGFIGF